MLAWGAGAGLARSTTPQAPTWLRCRAQGLRLETSSTHLAAVGYSCLPEHVLAPSGQALRCCRIPLMRPSGPRRYRTCSRPALQIGNDNTQATGKAEYMEAVESRCVMAQLNDGMRHVAGMHASDTRCMHSSDSRCMISWSTSRVADSCRQAACYANIMPDVVTMHHKRSRHSSRGG